MTEYKISPLHYKKLQKQTLIWSICLMTAGSVVGLIAVMYNSENNHMQVLYFVIPILMVIIAFNINSTLKQQKALLESYTIAVDAYSITRTQHNTPSMTIQRADISAIEDRGQCLIVKGKTALERIYIITKVNDYEQLVKDLEAIAPVIPAGGLVSQRTRTIAVTVLVLAGTVCVFTATHKMLVALSGTLVIGFLSYSMYVVWNSKNVDARTKKRSWTSLVLLLAVIGIMITKLKA